MAIRTRQFSSFKPIFSFYIVLYFLYIYKQLFFKISNDIVQLYYWNVERFLNKRECFEVETVRATSILKQLNKNIFKNYKLSLKNRYSDKYSNEIEKSLVKRGF